MTIVNTYVDYDFISKKLRIKYKLGVKSLHEYCKKRKFLTREEREKLRRLYCKNMEEINELADESNKSDDLLKYVLESPLKFKNAYSEVGRKVYKYVRNFPTPTNSIYQLVDTEASLQSIIGDSFNGIPYDQLKSSKYDEKLKYHTMESPYSHCVEYIMKCDYVFFEGEGLSAVQEYEIPPFLALMSLNGLCPNEFMPSDHFPVAAKFHYLPNP
eukprot:TRINITY_DN6006_c0_g1_i10.p1 TRINITY_DN6006_c0_g1~~TRINITY_DN6006_c0_g1_i10.p1  ORF type:complete len:214 (+),score=69.65 TRINITY_DN6006_c0_g1_i10:993-1634(+)